MGMEEGGKLEGGGLAVFRRRFVEGKGKEAEACIFLGLCADISCPQGGGDEKENWDRKNGAHAQPARIERRKNVNKPGGTSFPPIPIPQSPKRVDYWLRPNPPSRLLRPSAPRGHAPNSRKKKKRNSRLPIHTTQDAAAFLD